MSLSFWINEIALVGKDFSLFLFFAVKGKMPVFIRSCSEEAALC